MTGWVHAPGPDVWAADLGPTLFVPAPADVSLLPPQDQYGGIDYIVYPTGPGGVDFATFITESWDWIGTNAAYISRYYPSAVIGSASDTITPTLVPTAGSAWALAVFTYGPSPSFAATGTSSPSFTPESVAPTGGTLIGASPTPVIPPAEPRPTASLYDVDGTFLTELPLAAGIQWQDETSAPGALSLRLPLDDAATAQATSRRILKVHWRGAFRQAARIDSSSTDVAVDGRMWREWSNLPGLLSILGGVPVYPEYGLDRTSSSSRTFGYMSRYGHGAWLDSGNWSPAIGVRWSDMTGPRAGLPAGLDFPNPKWISKRGPMSDEPAFTHQWFRKMFDTSSQMTVQILATGDNYLDLWLDGEHIVESSSQNAFTWRDAFQVSQILPPSPVGGRHTIAARIRNNRDVANLPNRMAVLFTMQEVDASGEVIEQPPIINSDESWIVSDVAPGFRRAEVLLRLWLEADTYGYGAPGLIPIGFTITNDSAGQPWGDAPAEYTFDVGSSVLDALATFTEKDIDAAVDPDTLRLNLWNRRGADKTGTVRLDLGRDGGSLLAHRVERVEPQYNTILMQIKDGRWVQRQNLSAVTANGRESTGLSVGSTSDTGSANQVADAQLADLALPTITFTSQVSSLTGPQIYVDYDLGDTINVPDEDGVGYYAARVMAVTVDASSDGPVQVTPELMLDRSATPMVFDAGGPGAGDPGDLSVDWTPDRGVAYDAAITAATAAANSALAATAGGA